MVDKPRAGMWRYVKEAFLFRWNMLALGGAAAAAVIWGIRTSRCRSSRRRR